MKVKALTSFSGCLSMGINEVHDITDAVLLQDLLRAGYVEQVNPQTDAEKNAAEIEIKEPEAEAAEEQPEEPEAEPKEEEPEAPKQGKTAKKK